MKMIKKNQTSMIMRNESNDIQYKQTEENGQIADTKNNDLLKNQPRTRGYYKDNNYIYK